MRSGSEHLRMDAQNARAMSQKSNVYEQLRDAILSLDMAPGERLSERVLEGRYEASRTPIRAALARLETEGLVGREDRGWIVTPLSLAELEQAIEFRHVIEIEVVKLACKRAQGPDIDRIAKILHSCTEESSRIVWHQVGSAFHVELARLSGNDFYVRAVEDLMIRLSRARWLEVWTVEGRDRSWSEHRTILEQIRTNQVDEAVQSITAHVDGVMSRSISGDLAGRFSRLSGLSVVGKTS
jgi:DNA-binding GntR family transcriptional regulator